MDAPAPRLDVAAAPGCGAELARVAPLQRDAAPIGYVHSHDAGSMVDGPGMRLVIFLAGCLLRCQYCHNPDTWRRRSGRPTSVEETMRLVRRYERALRLGGGGVTLSGGEPMLQHRFVARVFRDCRGLGVHTCLDTSGRVGFLMRDEDLADIDLHLLDVKSGDPEIYARVTGQPLQPTLDYARRLAALQRPAWIRFVLVPGLTDGVDNVERLADIVAGLANVERVEILPFHQLGRDKWSQLGLAYPLAQTPPPAPALVERVRGQFLARGLPVA
jgi:pyruvate formate lyase activating enzyme